MKNNTIISQVESYPELYTVLLINLSDQFFNSFRGRLKYDNQNIMID